MFARSKNLIFASVAGVFLIGATGCTSVADPAEPTATTQIASPAPTNAKPSPVPKPTPTPVPASAKGPAQNWPVPKMPEAAKEQTKAGIKAFTVFYFELVDYTLLTYDTKPIKKVTEHSCYLCAKQVIDPADVNQKLGGWHVGGTTTLTVNFAKKIQTAGVSGFTFKREKTEVYRPDKALQGTIPAITRPVAGTLHLIFSNGWRVVDVEFVDPDGR